MVGVGLAVSLLLAGCQEFLYSQLSEQEANEVYTALARAGVPASKTVVDKRNWGIQVRAEDIPRAVEALDRVGLPRTRFSNLGEMFKREGIVSTPNEERVRFLYGVSQELSQTLSTIDGVVSARVHIVMPQNDPLADHAKPSSASVFIKHRADIDLQPMLSSIRSLVLRSVEGLSHDTVYVSLFPAEPLAPAQGEPLYAPILGVMVSRGMAAWLTPMLWVVGIGGWLLLGWMFHRYRTLVGEDLHRLKGRMRRKSDGSNPVSPAVSEASEVALPKGEASGDAKAWGTAR